MIILIDVKCFCTFYVSLLFSCCLLLYSLKAGKITDHVWVNYCNGGSWRLYMMMACQYQRGRYGLRTAAQSSWGVSWQSLSQDHDSQKEEPPCRIPLWMLYTSSLVHTTSWITSHFGTCIHPVACVINNNSLKIRACKKRSIVETVNTIGQLVNPTKAVTIIKSASVPIIDESSCRSLVMN